MARNTAISSPVHGGKHRSRRRRSAVKLLLRRRVPPYLWLYALGLAASLVVTYWLIRTVERGPASNEESG